MTCGPRKKKRVSSGGFTIVELAIVIIIAGLLILPLIRLYNQYLLEKRIKITRDNIAIISAEIAYFYANNLRLPCPAERDLPRGSANYYTEFDDDCTPADVGIGLDSCDMGEGICHVTGLRDTDGDTVNDPIVIGAVPIATLRASNGTNIPNGAGLDGWGNHITYAVTLRQARSGQFIPNGGVIRVIDEFGLPVSGISDNAHFVLVSHGDNRRGAFSIDGAKYSNCGLPATAIDNENCQGLGAADAVFVQALYSTANNANFYDDFLYAGKQQATSLWAYLPGTSNITNLNTDNVGVGTSTPQERLDVAGTIRMDRNARVNHICTVAPPSKCFSVRDLLLTGQVRCPAGQVMTGVYSHLVGANWETDADCVPPAFAAVTPSFTCPPGSWVHGIRTDGSVICWP